MSISWERFFAYPTTIPAAEELSVIIDVTIWLLEISFIVVIIYSSLLNFMKIPPSSSTILEASIFFVMLHLMLIGLLMIGILFVLTESGWVPSNNNFPT